MINDGKIKIIDFGLSKMADQLESGSLLGTLEYQVYCIL